MRKYISINLLFAISVLLAACGGAATPAGQATSKPVNISVSINPNPAMMGDIELVFSITDQNGSPVEGAKVDVSAEHTDMTGMGMSGPATEQGGGKYSIKANFQHSGTWMLTVFVRKDALDYKEDIEFPVQ